MLYFGRRLVTVFCETTVREVFWEDNTKQNKSVEIFTMISLTNWKNPKHCFVQTDVLQIKFLVWSSSIDNFDSK